MTVAELMPTGDPAAPTCAHRDGIESAYDPRLLLYIVTCTACGERRGITAEQAFEFDWAFEKLKAAS